MSQYIRFLNRLKEHARPEWLTPSQQKAYQTLLERLGFLDELNLWGRPGTGKTFLGWILHQQKKGIYVASAGHIPPSSGPSLAILDNLQPERAVIRALLSTCRAQDYKKVLFLTSEPVSDQIATLALELNAEDLQQAGQNWQSLGLKPLCEGSENLWTALRRSIFAQNAYSV